MAALELWKTEVTLNLLTPPLQDDTTNISLLINDKDAHPKFTSALGFIFACYSFDLLQVNQPCIDGSSSSGDYKNKLMTLFSFRTLCAQLLPGFQGEVVYSQENPEPPISLDQLHMFLDAHDTYVCPPWSFDSLFELYSNNPPLSFHCTWENTLCCSWPAFHQMYVDFARRSPRLVWNHMFAMSFDGFLDLKDDDDNDEYSQFKRATAARGLCVGCNQPATTHLTRRTLKCARCQEENNNDDDPLFVCC